MFTWSYLLWLKTPEKLKKLTLNSIEVLPDSLAPAHRWPELQELCQGDSKTLLLGLSLRSAALSEALLLKQNWAVALSRE